MNSHIFAEVEKTIVASIREQTKIAVLGLSGGADSLLVAILCSTALGPKNVYAFGMPYSELDKKTFNTRSREIAEKLDINYQEISIKLVADDVTSTALACVDEIYSPSICKHDISRTNAGNARARARMMFLYTMAAAIGEQTDCATRVVGTGNLSEDYIGYFTKYGDGGVDFSPIAELFKSEVYYMLDAYVQQGRICADMIDRKPSAGLWEGQSDEDELGHTYAEMEQAIRKIMRWQREKSADDRWTGWMNDVEKFVWAKYVNNSHKLVAPPVTKVRHLLVDQD